MIKFSPAGGFIFGGVGGESLFSRARNFPLDGKLTFSLLTRWGGLIGVLVGFIVSTDFATSLEGW